MQTCMANKLQFDNTNLNSSQIGVVVGGITKLVWLVTNDDPDVEKELEFLQFSVGKRPLLVLLSSLVRTFLPPN